MTTGTYDTFIEQALRYRRFLYGHAYTLVRNAHDADDLVQEALVRGWRKFHLFEQGTNLRAWLARILTNLFMNECCRRRRRLRAGPIHEMESYLPPHNDAFHAPSFEGRVPEELLADDTFADHVAGNLVSGLCDLTPEHRDVLMMSSVGGLSYRDMARKLKVPIGTVTSRFHRARHAMQSAPALTA